jgi:hypothetical protein
MRITTITTLNHNVGDDFVREGILYLLRKVIPNAEISNVHKHIPLTTRPEWEWLYTHGVCRWIDRIPRISALGVTRRLDSLLPLNCKTDKILNCELLVQSGAPVYWLHGGASCAGNEWFDPLIRRRWCSVREHVPFISLAGGACQAYNSDGSEFEASIPTLAYIREFFDACRITTLRDPLAAKILSSADRKASVLPCTSIFARIGLGIEPEPPKYIALNYMPMGGHYVYKRGQSGDVWENTFREFVKQLPSDEEYHLVCHNRAELAEARRLFPRLQTFWSPNYRDYLRFFARAKFGIFNRVHAAFALASFGRPSLVAGNDSRARMAHMIGLKDAFVGDLNTVQLIAEFERLRSSWHTYSNTMSQLQFESENAYVLALRNALPEFSSQRT